ncbi:hypothetical protein PUN28_015003 [Cardiocondyla obscurior]|uniref:Mab-21-like HhH/H2TH-like domain-containing protein n=2 Tax=Cardiocondyla obscurior TaxID=286306 RepID=A0AAW2EWG7_9HYME
MRPTQSYSNRNNPNKKKNYNKEPNNCSTSNQDNEELEWLLKETVDRDPPGFILNNLMMCIQFFENFEEDIRQIKESLASSSESKYNENLPPQKHVLLPDVLQEHISHNFDFTSKRKTGVLVIEPLQPVRIYVVHDNIEITEQSNSPEYSSLNNGITYNMKMTKSDNPGYVFLQLLGKSPYSITTSGKEKDIGPSSTADDDEMYDDRNSNTMPSYQIRKRGLQTYSIFKTKSLPNLHDNDIIYEDQSISCKNTYGSRYNFDIKAEFDFEQASSIKNGSHNKMTWSKNELRVKNQNYPRYDSSSIAKSTILKVHRPASIASSGYRSGACDSDSNYSYLTLSKLNMQGASHSKAEPMIYPIYPNARLPPQCFKKMKIDNDKKLCMLQQKVKAQNRAQLLLNIADRQNNRDVYCISSKEFMDYFFFFCKNQLLEPLGLKLNDLGPSKESVIYSEKLIKRHDLNEFKSAEISPTMQLQWPTCAQEWLNRQKRTWPEASDISKVKAFGCYVIPENSLPKKSKFIPEFDYEIEWQLVFPAAERYLETCMTRSQVQVYLIALMLHKTFLRSTKDTIGLNTSHIRHTLFWLIEEGKLPNKFSDNQTGKYLMKLLDKLYCCVKSNPPELKDYFLPQKNMFNKISRGNLYNIQKQLKRVKENPVMYVFYAMQNIQHSDKFFPQLNFPKLHKILTMRQMTGVNQTSYMNSLSKTSESSKTMQNNGPSTFTSRTLITPYNPMDHIVEISEQCPNLKYRQQLAYLLDFFIDHFINMAEYCHKYRADQQKTAYLKQADQLFIILSKSPWNNDKLKTYYRKISDLKDRSIARSNNKPPETPKRNVTEPIYSSSLINRFSHLSAENSHLPRNEQSQSSQKDYADKITKMTDPEERLTNEEFVQTDVTSTITSKEEVPCTSRELPKNVAETSKNQDDATIPGAMPNVISLSDNLNDTTYI